MFSNGSLVSFVKQTTSLKNKTTVSRETCIQGYTYVGGKITADEKFLREISNLIHKKKYHSVWKLITSNDININRRLGDAWWRYMYWVSYCKEEKYGPLVWQTKTGFKLSRWDAAEGCWRWICTVTNEENLRTTRERWLVGHVPVRWRNI